MKYCKESHIKLVKYSQELASQGKELYLESEKDFDLLMTYTAMLINHLHWENRYQYYELIEELLNGPIAFLKLRKRHRLMNDAGGRLAEEWMIFLEPNEKARGFDALIDELVSLFDRYNPEPSLRESH
jgi:hypothetical protein